MDFEKLVQKRIGCDEYNYFSLGNDYYRSRNTYIMERKKQIYLEGLGVQENPFGSNHKLPSGHFKKIVDQKVMYLLGNGVYFNEENAKEKIDTYFENGVDEMLIDMGIETSKKGESWLYAYKNNGIVQFTMIPAEQITPIFDEYNKLVKVVRRFDDEDYLYMHVFDEQTISIYRKKKMERDYKLIEQTGHWVEYQTFNGEIVGEPELHGFGIVPFIPLWNNRDKVSDLYPIKTLIDTYDIINSDFANNIDDMQEAFFYLKGYTGDTKNLAEFMRQLKMYKAVPVAEDGAVQADQLQIPTEARRVFLERLEKDIYKFAMGVDLTNVQGGSITNVFIKAMFSDLDLKADQFESEVRKFLYKVIDFITLVSGVKIEKDVYFERSIIMNQQEIIDSIIKLNGILSQQTIIELLPYDIDYEQEFERLQDEASGIKLDNNDMDMNNEDNQDTNDNNIDDSNDDNDNTVTTQGA